MMKSLSKIVSIFFFALSPIASYADFSLIGGMNQYSLHSATATSSTKFAPQGGIGLSFSILEINALYTVRDLGRSSTTQSLQMPVFLRFPMGSPLQLGVGGFADYALKSLAGVKRLDYGVAASLRMQLPISMSMSVFVDGRYLFGLADLNGSKSRDLGLLAGIVFR